MKFNKSVLLSILTSLIFFGVLASVLAANDDTIPDKNKWVPSINSDHFGFVAVGDMGTGWMSEYKLSALIDKLSTKDYPAIILLGDIVYPSAKKDLIEPNFIKPFQPCFDKGFRFYAVLGNHDWLAEKAIHIKNYFESPDYYTFKIGPTQFWALNSNDFNPQQAKWLDQSAKESNAKWKVALLHHSPYCSGLIHGNNFKMIERVNPILAANHFDICLSGHNHIYERLGPIDGVTYVVSGGGSAYLHKYDPKLRNETKVIKSCHHYLRAYGDSSRFAMDAIDENGNVVDSILLRK
jgi:predicted phosphodiesterase